MHEISSKQIQQRCGFCTQSSHSSGQKQVWTAKSIITIIKILISFFDVKQIFMQLVLERNFFE